MTIGAAILAGRFFIGPALDTAWYYPDLVLDVEDGEPEGFSLGPGSGQMFITRPAGMAALVAEGDQVAASNRPV
jgi:uncharacterized protein (DUF779 family)